MLTICLATELRRITHAQHEFTVSNRSAIGHALLTPGADHDC